MGAGVVMGFTLAKADGETGPAFGVTERSRTGISALAACEPRTGPMTISVVRPVGQEHAGNRQCPASGHGGRYRLAEHQCAKSDAADRHQVVEDCRTGWSERKRLTIPPC